ncbi:hypothetical protein ACNKHR_01815 [Shigella flexneri]
MFIVLNAPVPGTPPRTYDTIRFSCSALVAGYRDARSCICSKPCFIIITMCMSRRSFVAEATILVVFYADAIREQIQAMQHLRLQDDEYQWLSALPFFKADDLYWSRQFRL